MEKGHFHYELGTLQGRGKRHQGQTIGNRLAEGQGERAERVRARLNKGNTGDSDSDTSRGTVTALPGMMDGESHIFSSSQGKDTLCVCVCILQGLHFDLLKLYHLETGNFLLNLQEKKKKKSKFFTEL